MGTTVVVYILVLLLSGSRYAAAGTSPTFDCGKASGTVEKTICSDDALAALDRKMAEVYAKALTTWPADVVTKEKALQRGWIKGRNECWKSDDVRSCVELAYRTRIVEVQIRSGQLEAPTPVGYVCEGSEGTPFLATFYGTTDPPSAVITYGNDQVIAFQAPSGSGARYTAANMEFWEHHGEATVDWYGTRLRCKVRKAAAGSAADAGSVTPAAR